MSYQASRPLASSIILVVYECEQCFNWFVVRKRNAAIVCVKEIGSTLVVTVDVVVYNNRKDRRLVIGTLLPSLLPLYL